MMVKSFMGAAVVRLMLAVGLSAALVGCATLERFNPFGPGKVVETQPLSSANVCHSHGTQMQLHWLADAGALNAFEQAHDFHFEHARKLPPGPYALIELGTRDRPDYGLAVSRQAHDFGDTLVLDATFFTPPDQPADAKGSASGFSPCVLVGLPTGAYRHIQLRDPAGALRVSSGLIPRSSKGE